MSKRRKYQDHLDGAKYAMQYSVCVFNNILLNNRIEQCISNLFNAWTYVLIATCIKHNIKYKKDQKNKEYKSAEEMFRALLAFSSKEKGAADKNAMHKNFLLIRDIRDNIVHKHPQVGSKNLRAIYPKLQTCLENLQWWLCQEFGDKNKISIAFSIPLYLYEDELDGQLEKKTRTQKDVSYLINQFEKGIDEETLSNPRYCRKIAIFVGELKNHQSKETINFVNLGKIDDSVDFNNRQTLIGLKIVSDIDKFTLLPKGVTNKIKESGFPNFSINCHSNAFKHFTENGKLYKRKYWVTTSDNKRFYSQEWVNFLMAEIKQDADLLNSLKSKKISANN